MSLIARKLMSVAKVGDPPPDPDLVLVFDTTLATGTTVTVPLAGAVDVVIDWGDGNSEAFTTTGNKTHTYASEGEYTVRVSGSLGGFGGFVTRPNLTKCLSFGDLGLFSLFRAFGDCANLVEVPKSVPSSVANMNSMFFRATSFNQNIGSWDMSNVTNTSGMLRGTPFNQNLGSWNMGSVTNMTSMFRDAPAMTFPLGSWQTNLSSQPNAFSLNANATFQSFRGTADFPLLADGVTRVNT